MTRPVLVAAGGTGGHVIPALAVAEVLRQGDVPVIWLGTHAGLEARLVPAAGIEIRWINVAGLRGKNLLQTLVGPLKLLRACLQCIRLMHSLKPRAVLGMGGFVSGPVGIAALLLGKPLVLHEQNAVAGMTNRWLSSRARRVFAAWPDTFKSSTRLKVVGNPVRADIALLAASPRIVELDPSRPLRILVVGGSRGARALNEVVPAAAAQLEMSVQIVHQSGSVEGDLVRQRYQAIQPENDLSHYEVCEFIDDMAAAYQHADVVICRSGAMTVTELGALGVPSILVPFPFAVDDHQTRNAEQLAESGAAVLMPQNSLNADSLAAELVQLADDRKRLKSMSEAARRCFVPKAAEVVAEALLEVSR
ncbi:undecaprenyldiphospho-muramoylpentapeptide beta-N-acetylglucosaminyltransferase [Granulosicoccus antarcticus]|uniref:UDP-N-acetylglucosamine--N-acetylmuramyl-(pentapeptide) pyrophosphoryl-undecaprenol N-acetylglucosamine transferase n=1 Tax=Granulosicoccus antarcticus IMCC3135 TaxID=1192854 RepID=A0A2Z2P5C2_9GAMM|nr:undecaprenyldiphospho-muramoylpentapeptide beta-N-acetylglucosaminyltransferase [Granulosicoccus antarcticus]ASJ75887.1 UDP-N-acetylglucosamine--N-acetylmuramyl-(pentapeptide) pyrophosphoryl-undecaprenol N-acetylglucosamine transferase [Granulosicoccus antarcticus IMCC3135]